MKRIVVCFLFLTLVFFASNQSLAQSKGSKLISIPASAFQPVSVGDGVYYTNDGDDVHISGPFDSGVHYHYLTAPLILEHGKRITKIVVYAAQGHQFGSGFKLIRSRVNNIGLKVRNVVANISLSGEYENNAIRKFTRLFFYPYHTINNNKSTYFLQFYARSQEAGDKSYIHHVEIYYKDAVSLTLKNK